MTREFKGDWAQWTISHEYVASVTPHCVLKSSYLFKSHFYLKIPTLVSLDCVNFIMQDTLLDETEHWELNVYLPYDYFLFTVESWTNSQKTLQKKNSSKKVVKKVVKWSHQKSRQKNSSKQVVNKKSKLKKKSSPIKVVIKKSHQVKKTVKNSCQKTPQVTSSNTKVTPK